MFTHQQIGDVHKFLRQLRNATGPRLPADLSRFPTEQGSFSGISQGRALIRRRRSLTLEAREPEVLCARRLLRTCA